MCKTFIRLLLPLLAAAAATACIRIPKQPRTDGNTAPLTYRFDGGADLTSLFTLKAAYLTDGGRTETEWIQSLPWTKEVGVHTPFEARLEVKFEKKSGFAAQPEYAVGFSGAIGFGGTQTAAFPPPSA